jgi:hypothetical protein
MCDKFKKSSSRRAGGRGKVLHHQINEYLKHNLIYVAFYGKNEKRQAGVKETTSLVITRNKLNFFKFMAGVKGEEGGPAMLLNGDDFDTFEREDDVTSKLSTSRRINLPLAAQMDLIRN